MNWVRTDDDDSGGGVGDDGLVQLISRSLGFAVPNISGVGGATRVKMRSARKVFEVLISMFPNQYDVYRPLSTVIVITIR